MSEAQQPPPEGLDPESLEQLLKQTADSPDPEIPPAAISPAETPAAETPAADSLSGAEPPHPKIAPATAPSSVDPAAVSAFSFNAAANGPLNGETSEPESLDNMSIEELLKQASFEDPSMGDPSLGDPSMGQSSGRPQGDHAAHHGGHDHFAAGQALADAAAFKLPDFNQVMQDAQVSSIDLLRDVELNVKIELGRSRMLVEDVLKLSEGSVVELDKLAGDPVDVFVNERLVARGEVLVLNDNFCVRVNEIVAGVKEEGL